MKTTLLPQTNLLLSLLTPLLLFYTAIIQAENINNINKKTKPRLITLAPHLTEMVYSAGAGNLLVATVNYSDYPKIANKLPIVGDYNQIHIEQIIKLKPSLIIAWKSGNTPQDIQRLKKLGFNVWQTEIKQLSDIPSQIQQIGKKTNQQITANKIAQQLQQILTTTKQQYQTTTSKPTVFYQIWDKPLYTVGKNQFISQAIQLCGATNLFEQINILAPQVSTEAVIKQNPDLIILGGNQQKQSQWQKNWQQYPTISAVKNKHIIKIKNSLYQRPTARFIKAIPQLCKQINQHRVN